MRNIFLLALLLLATSAIFSQNIISLKGKIIDKNSTLPLESVTIYLKTLKYSRNKERIAGLRGTNLSLLPLLFLMCINILLLSISSIFKLQTSLTLIPVEYAKEIIDLCFKFSIFEILSSKNSLSITFGSFYSALGFFIFY